MITPEKIKTLSKKVSFVKALNDVLPTYQTNVAGLRYDVFENEESGYTDEYLVIEYVGGACSYRNCNGDSISAIFEEIAGMLDHGYYAEERDYNIVKASGQLVKFLKDVYYGQSN